MRCALFVLAGLGWASILSGTAQEKESGSNINPDQAFAWGANIGWTTWHPDSMSGVRISEFACSGHIYAANAGWINLGSGQPQNGVYYQNQSADDFGVNLDLEGNLRGLAYGANIGWISFETNGAPRIDFMTGKIEGHIYGANVGWISLSGPDFHVAADAIDPGEDTDGDGIPDAWELIHAGDLDTFGPDTDADGDGLTDQEEYLAGTDLFDPDDNLQILQFSLLPEQESAIISFTTSPHRIYRVQASPAIGTESDWTELEPGDLQVDVPTATAILTNWTDVTNAFLRIEAIRPLFRE